MSNSPVFNLKRVENEGFGKVTEKSDQRCDLLLFMEVFVIYISAIGVQIIHSMIAGLDSLKILFLSIK